MNVFFKYLISIYNKLPFLGYIWNKLPSKVLLPVFINGRMVKVYKGHWAGVVSGSYEPDTLNLFTQLLENSSHFLDVGANVGLFSIIAAAKGTKVTSFEPHPVIRKVLKKNLKGLPVKIYDFAASDSEEDVRLFISDEPGSHSLSMKQSDYVLVRSIEIDKIVKEDVDLIKIDVEGAEVKALKGMHNILSKNKPILIIEVDEVHLNRFGEDFNSLKTHLEKYGYKNKKIANENNYIFS